MYSEEAATLLHQYSEWLDGEGIMADTSAAVEHGTDDRSHDELVSDFLTTRSQQAIPEITL